MKKTKIICTMGPACSDEKTVKRMVEAGMNVARMNFSHGTHEDHKKNMDLIKKIRDENEIPIAIMLDTKGPEYRIKTFRNGKATLRSGDTFILTTDDIIGDDNRVSVSYKGTIQELSVGDQVLINNGLIILVVESKTNTEAVCRVLEGGVLTDRKSMSFPNKVLKQVYLSDADKDDILFGIEQDVDFIAASFVSCKQDVIDIRKFLDENGGEYIDIIAKIENRSGVDNIADILEVSDGIMVARGDLGVEIPYEELPSIQKRLINTCRIQGKRVITATEMLESMITNPRPTRAEISDVANAVYDGTSALMLSGETAAGKFPVQAVETMSKIAEQTEKDINYYKRFHNTEFDINSPDDAISHATCELAMDLDAKLMIVCTLSGRTARLVSRFRSPKPILAMTTNRKSWNKLAMSWSVNPIMCDEFPDVGSLFYSVTKQAKEEGYAEKGDKVVITAGIVTGFSGGTNLIKFATVN
jgi:pyruvate kinase